ncbi:MAG: NHL repeat-containing protein [candidate division KSB1 bacterium]|nr:NHL repeat-containing protein [candidate division KSB1 bacterium]MDQ7065107.1 NHL repeat-containing protein [candidate division KSB1 bacterium]
MLKRSNIRLLPVIVLWSLAACTASSPLEPEFVREWGGTGNQFGQFHEPIGIAVAPDGAVYVADAGNHRIQKFTAAGEFLFAWGDAGSEPGQFEHPMHLAVDARGRVLVPNYGNDRIQQFRVK